MGFFGAKHCDKSLLLAYTISSVLWFLFMGVTNFETLDTYFFNCDTDDAGNAKGDQAKWCVRYVACFACLFLLD
jgi:hypothetical protein